MLIQQVEGYFNCTFKKFDTDGKFYRAGNKDEFWAIGSTANYGGKDHEFITSGNWKTGERKNFTSWEKDLERKDPGFRKFIAKTSTEINSKVSLEEEEKWSAAKEKALGDILTFSKNTNSAQYLSIKKVEAFGNLFADDEDNLIIPTYESDESIVGYQRITPHGKWFQQGQKTRGVFFPIGKIEKSEIVYVAEGYATAATIHALTGYPVVVCFTCYNIKAAVMSVREHYGFKKIVIAADNDKKKAGEIYAERACKTLAAIQYVMPDFGSNLSELTDFNDLYVSDGAEKAMKQLSFDPSKFNHVSMLGHAENKYYFYSERSKTVRSFTPSEMRAGDLITMAKETYWASKYWHRSENPEFCDWKKTSEILIDVQEQEHGFFSPDNVRGFGFWQDGKDFVFNNADTLYKNDEKVQFGHINKKYFYTPSGVGAVPLTSKVFPRNFIKLKEALDLTSFRSDKDRIGFLGFIAQAPVFSCLDWKSHIWFVGPAGSGKTTVMDLLHKVLINSRFFLDSTPAGIKQTIKSDAIVTIVDEAEGDNKNTQRLMDIARHSSRGQGATVARGTPLGRALSQNVTTVFCFGSIQQPSMSIADESRVFNVSLKPNKGHVDISREHARKDAYHEASKLGPEIFNFMCANVKQYIKKIEEVKNTILLCGASTRQADQYSNLIAGYLMLCPNENADDVVNLFIREEIEMTRPVENFNEEFLDSIVSLKLKDDSKDVLLGDKIKDSFTNSKSSEWSKQFLKMHGMKAVGNFLHFSKNNALKKEFEKIGIPNFWNVIKNDKDHFSSSLFRFDGSEKVLRSYKIDKKMLF